MEPPDVADLGDDLRAEDVPDAGDGEDERLDLLDALAYLRLHLLGLNNAGEFSIDKMLGMRDRPVRQADANSENASTTSAMRITVF